MKNKLNTALVTVVISLVLIVTSITLGLFWVLTGYQGGAIRNHIGYILDK